MTVHFICRGNVLRSLIAETYLKSLGLPGVEVMSSGVNVDLSSPVERQFFANTLAVLARHNLSAHVKNTSHQLTQARVDNGDITICMNQRVIDEAEVIVRLPANTQNWHVTDIGEGARADRTYRDTYEEDIFQEIVRHVDNLIEYDLYNNNYYCADATSCSN